MVRVGRRIFLSFDHDGRLQVQGFRLMQWNPNLDFEFTTRDLLTPVSSENPDYICAKIREQMKGTSCIVVLLGKRTAQSYWVDFEIREALKDGKGVLGIRLKDAGGVAIPPALEEAKAKVIDWDPHQFEDEINKACLIAERPLLAPPTRGSTSSVCGR